MTVHEFADLVRTYIALMRKGPALSPYELLRACASVLPRIYAAGLDLPEVDPDDSDPPGSVPPPPVPNFGRYDIYSEVFDPYEAGEPVAASLAGDLTEIYTDLAAPLREYEAGRIANATWSWRFNITTHSGDHLVDAMRAIHRLVNDHMPEDFDPTADATA